MKNEEEIMKEIEEAKKNIDDMTKKIYDSSTAKTTKVEKANEEFKCVK